MHLSLTVQLTRDSLRHISLLGVVLFALPAPLECFSFLVGTGDAQAHLVLTSLSLETFVSPDSLDSFCWKRYLKFKIWKFSVMLLFAYYYFCVFLLLKVVEKMHPTEICLLRHLSTQFNDTKHVHIVIQPLLLPVSRTFSSDKHKSLHSLKYNSSLSSIPTLANSFYILSLNLVSKGSRTLP